MSEQQVYGNGSSPLLRRDWPKVPEELAREVRVAVVLLKEISLSHRLQCLDEDAVNGLSAALADVIESQSRQIDGATAESFQWGALERTFSGPVERDEQLYVTSAAAAGALRELVTTLTTDDSEYPTQELVETVQRSIAESWTGMRVPMISGMDTEQCVRAKAHEVLAANARFYRTENGSEVLSAAIRVDPDHFGLLLGLVTADRVDGDNRRVQSFLTREQGLGLRGIPPELAEPALTLYQAAIAPLDGISPFRKQSDRGSVSSHHGGVLKM